MEISRKFVNNIVIVVLGIELSEKNTFEQVDLDTENSNILEKFVDDELKRQHIYYIIDLHNIEHIYSYGIAALFNAYKKINNYGGKIKLLNPSSSVVSILNTLKVTSLFEVFFDLEEAINSF
ncbi:MAG: hypothetical protein A2Y40_05210 [Candidatus Margulisbacteria bacterium GWF2_35_9]|nr:MAG: hypothetical protein A2Y40_05210 [Candidatus Margulisbacteria bacterium GWF2_35_9]